MDPKTQLCYGCETRLGWIPRTAAARPKKWLSSAPIEAELSPKPVSVFWASMLLNQPPKLPQSLPPTVAPSLPQNCLNHCPKCGSATLKTASIIAPNSGSITAPNVAQFSPPKLPQSLPQMWLSSAPRQCLHHCPKVASIIAPNMVQFIPNQS